MKRILTATLLVLGAAHSAAAATIEWQVVQPFRFLRYQSDHRLQEMAFETASQRPAFKAFRVSTMESVLNDRTWWNTADGTSPAPVDAIAAMRASESRQPVRPDIRLGWSSLLRVRENSGIDEGTCWSAVTQSFFGCTSAPGAIEGGNSYIYPEHHIVRVSVSGASEGEECTLALTESPQAGYGFLEDNAFSGTRETAITVFDCASFAYLRVPEGATMTITGSAGGQLLDDVPVKVRDMVVASIGDSFSSGEGNPDLPALLDDNRVVRPRYELDGSIHHDIGVPRRKAYTNGQIAPFSSARWVDRRCHRSMYSAHTRAAIALALSGDRHHAITYVTFACSGAEITDGFFWPQDGQECTSGASAGSRYLEPQISAMVGALGQTAGAAQNYRSFPNTLNSADRYRKDVLEKIASGTAAIRDARGNCQSWPGPTGVRSNPRLRTALLKRPIDVLFVSVGGNDMGFAPLVTSVVVTSGATQFAIGDLMAKVYALAAGGISLSEARRNMSHLRERYAMLAQGIRQKLEISDPSRVLITAYPSPAFDRTGALCNTGRLGMNASRIFRLAGPGSTQGRANIEEAQQIVTELNQTIRSTAQTFGYTFVNSFENRFRSHGLCATRLNGGTAEEMDLPHKTQASTAWQPFHPVRDFYLYAKRQRWFRTFNDSFLATYHFKGNATETAHKDLANSFFLAYRTLGGAVHPSAEGHAAVADSIYCAAAAKVLAGQDSAQCE